MLRSLFSKISVASFVGAAVAQATAGIRNEVNAAKTEFTNKIKAIAFGALLALFGAGLALFATGFIAYAGLIALADVWSMWLAALVIAGALLLIASIFLTIGLRRIHKNSDLRPERLLGAYRRFNLEDD
ncbi:MAG: phage holin family protein [Demequinaceae bacterium]|nr:phage holin family protein [Demequinaceae bacterium]